MLRLTVRFQRITQCLQENFWDAQEQVAIERYYVIDDATGEEYRSLLAGCGFGEAAFYPSLGGEAGSPQAGLIAILSQKKAA